jgi:hypothetical protein
MNAYQIERAYLKVITTIKSCTTKDQLRVAERMADLFISRFTKPTVLKLNVKTLIQNHSINCI